MQNSSLWRAARPYPHSAFLGAKYFQGHQNPLENSASTWELRSWGQVSKNLNSGLWAHLFSPLLQSTFSYLWLVLIWITTEIAFRCSAPSQAEQLELASVWSLKNSPCPAWATVVCWVLFFSPYSKQAPPDTREKQLLDHFCLSILQDMQLPQLQSL